jgi:hypothetical protein
VKKFIKLNDWFETGMEGTDWIGYDFLGEEFKWVLKFPWFRQVISFPSMKKSWKPDFSILKKEYTKSNYDNIIILKDGDKLTIFKDYSSTEILWKGVISKERGNRLSSNNRWCHWIQKGVPADTWGKYFIEERYAYIERGE